MSVIDSKRREIIEGLDVRAEPYGATAASVRRESNGETAASLEQIAGEYETTYCLDQYACGHEL